MSSPHPTNRPGFLRLFSPAAQQLEIRFAPLSDRDKFNPPLWPRRPLVRFQASPGWWECDIDALALADGQYEYEFLLNGDPDDPIPDPYADEITRFGGYRGIFHIVGARRKATPAGGMTRFPLALCCRRTTKSSFTKCHCGGCLLRARPPARSILARLIRSFLSAFATWWHWESTASNCYRCRTRPTRSTGGMGPGSSSTGF